MAYKYTTGSVFRGDIFFEDDRSGAQTYIDFGQDTITLRPSGTAQLYVEDEKVGIGTTSPDHTLHVTSPGTCHVKIESEAGYEAALKLSQDGQSSAYVWMPGSTSDLRFYINGDDVMHLDSNGNVGIGVTDPDTLFEVAGAVHLSGEIATPSAPADGDGGILYPKTDGKLYWRSNEVAETDLTAGGGGGGISFNGSTANGLVTYGNATTADVETNILFNNNKLSVGGAVSGSGELEIVGDTVLGGDLSVSGSLRAKQIHITQHAWTTTSTNTAYIPFYDLAEHTSTNPGYRVGMIAPFGGRLLRVLFRPQNGQAGSVTVGIHTGSNTESGVDTTAIESITITPINAGYTTSVYNFTATSHFTAESFIGVSIDPNNSTNACTAVCVWEFDMFI